MKTNVPRVAFLISLLHCVTAFSCGYLSSQTQTLKIAAPKPWINDNVRVFQTSLPLRNPFVDLVPVMGRGCDVSVTWSDPHEGAQHLAEKCFRNKEKASNAAQILEEAMERFKSITIEEGVVNASLRARIVASRGAFGVKCPRWHYDHVPLRHIQALVGPGCDYLVSDVGVDRSMVNQADESENKGINEGIVDPVVANIRRGREGEAVVLRGTDGCCRPAVHKSPNLQWWQGRVLMTLDILAYEY